jgi:hypothetical protein
MVKQGIIITKSLSGKKLLRFRQAYETVCVAYAESVRVYDNAP